MRQEELFQLFKSSLKKVQDSLIKQYSFKGTVYDCAEITTLFNSSLAKALSQASRVKGGEKDSIKSSRQAELSKITFECALRFFVWDYRCQVNNQSLSFTAFYLLFDFLLYLAEKDVCDLSFPLLMIEEFAFTSSINDLAFIVEYMSDRLTLITHNMVPMKGKGLAFLRICNELQRRCSKLSDAQISGELKILLSIAFPLNERSGLNLRGDFDIGNQVPFNLEDAFLDNASSDFKEEYQLFWKLQESLANPTLIFEDASFETFQNNVEWILKNFEINIRDARSKVKAHKKSISEKRHSSSLSEVFGKELPLMSTMPRFLTNASLLPSQLCEPKFQQIILVQLLIVLQYLLSIDQEDHAKFPVAAKPSQNFSWKEEQTQWLSEKNKEIYLLLRDIPFGSDKFLKFIKSMLKVEQAYSDWKNNGCGAFRFQDGKKLTPAEEKLRAEAEASEVSILEKNLIETKERLEINLPPLEDAMSKSKLSALWKLGANNKVFPKGVSLKRGRPSLDEFISSSVDKVTSLNDKDDYRRAISWKALRLANVENISLVAKSESFDFLALQGTRKSSSKPSHPTTPLRSFEQPESST